MSYLLLSLQIENIENFTDMFNKSLNFKNMGRMKYTLYLFYKYFTQSVVSSLLFILGCFFLKENEIYHALFLFLIPLYRTHPFIIYTSYFSAVYLDQPLLLLGVLFFRFRNFKTFNLKLPTPIKFLVVLMILPTLSEYVIILVICIIVSDIAMMFTESKKILRHHKSYYMLSVLAGKWRLLNPNMMRTIMSYIFLLVLLSFNLSVTSKLMAFLTYFYLLFYEIDVLFKYHFFNQSKLYSDRLSRVSFNLLILNGISFLFLIEHIPNISIIPFIIWYLFWIGLFSMRSLKILSVLLLLVGCSNTRLDTLTLESKVPSFVGNMTPVVIQEHVIDTSYPYTLHFKDHAYVKSGDTIITYELSENINEIKRIDHQIQSLQKSIDSLKSRLNDALDKAYIQTEIDTLNSEITNLQFEKKMIKTSTHIKADIEGSYTVHQDTLKITSNKKVLKLTLNEHAYRMFIKYKEFDIYSLENDLIFTVSDYQTDSNSNLEYVITFEHFENDAYLYESFILKPSNIHYEIPKTYIYQRDNNLYATIDSKEVKVYGERQDDVYLIKEGLKDGDVLEKPFH